MRRLIGLGVTLVLGAACGASVRLDSPPESPESTAAAEPLEVTSPGPTAAPSPAPDGNEGGGTHGSPARVTRVIDGDTVEVSYQGRTLDVRLIGIDTPETVHPSEPVECYGRAASDFTKRSLEGERVEIEFDVERLDRYGRTLAYVWLDGELFNEVLVARGFAQVSTYPPNVKYVDLFLAAQRQARSRDRGLWGECPLGGGAGGGGGEGDGGGNCDPSYPGVCIPPPPPDLDCADVSFTNFEVIGSDPHGFDGDGDGRGCEI